MSKEMLINVADGEECRLAVLEDNVLQELYTERASEQSQVGNIYKARVTNVEPSIQAAFIDFGAPRNGFLHISDLQARYFPKDKRVEEPVGKKISRKDRPPIQECLRRGQEVVCQVIKAGIGTKGPTLTTYPSVPGRFVVMMPGMTRLGVSRKIEDEDERRKLRKILEEINPPSEIGFIARTASLGRTKKDLQSDLHYLQRLWRSVERRVGKAKAPAELYTESDLVIRTIRDVYSSEIRRIICDNAEMARNVADFLKVAMPRGKNAVQYYTGQTPLFHRYGLDEAIEKMHSRHVELPGGASLVIDQAEALVAIDVNSGRNRSGSDAEQTAYRTNLTAAKEVARQLRLRDMGGVIVIDFIDMRFDRHQREVERVLREQLKKDRARSKLLRISKFGLVEMTRQRIRPSLTSSIFQDCPHCNGTGIIKSPESHALAVLRDLQLATADDRIARVEMTVAPPVAEFLNNQRRKQLSELEAESGKSITVHGKASLAGDNILYECYDDRGGLVGWQSPTAGGSVPLPPKAAARLAVGPPPPEELVDAQTLEPAHDRQATAKEETPLEPQPQQTAEAEQRETADEGQDQPDRPKKRRRRGGRKHRRKKTEVQETQATETPQAPEPVKAPAEPQTVASPEPEPPGGAEQASAASDGEGEPKKKRRRRGGRRHRRKRTPDTAEGQAPHPTEVARPTPKPQSAAPEAKASGEPPKPAADTVMTAAIEKLQDETVDVPAAQPETKAEPAPGGGEAEPAAEPAKVKKKTAKRKTPKKATTAKKTTKKKAATKKTAKKTRKKAPKKTTEADQPTETPGASPAGASSDD
ncbi:MAG: Rne/Rng family ribonuclease [Planctomycetota bacterium]